MPAPNSPLAVNPSHDEAYFVSKGFSPDVARAMAEGGPTTPAEPAVQPPATSPPPAEAEAARE